MEDPLYTKYHDEEWGVPHADNIRLFEKLNLEGFQAGLSWITILRKRENFRRAFHGFDPERIRRYGDRDIERLMQDPGIVRNRMKIEATIENARAYLALSKSQKFSDFLWEEAGGKPIRNRPRSMKDLPPHTEASRKLSKALKKAGFHFVGPTTIYAFMQSVGIVNDHLVQCPRHAVCAKLQDAFAKTELAPRNSRAPGRTR
jgi:DNA-3-methyladenine glycosylase I